MSQTKITLKVSGPRCVGKTRLLARIAAFLEQDGDAIELDRSIGLLSLPHLVHYEAGLERLPVRVVLAEEHTSQQVPDDSPRNRLDVIRRARAA